MGRAADVGLALSLGATLWAWLPERPRPPHVVSAPPRRTEKTPRRAAGPPGRRQRRYHGDVKFLVARHAILGAQHLHNPKDLHFAGWAVQAAASYMRPEAKNVFVGGVGSGSVVKELRHRHLDVRAVEIDEAIARLARHEFGVGCSPGDAVDVIEHVRAGSHDLVLFDAFDGRGLESTWRFLRTETMRHVKASFKNETRGLLSFVVQVAGEAEADDDVLHRAAAVMAREYRFVKAFRDSPPGSPGPYGRTGRKQKRPRGFERTLERRASAKGAARV